MNVVVRRKDLFWPVVLLAFLAVAGVAAAGVALVAEFDSVSAQRERSVVANGIQSRIDEAARMTTPEVVWDDAVRHLDNHFDLDWARDNVGAFLWQNNRFTYSFVLDADDAPLFAADKGVVVDRRRYASFSGGVAPLVAAVRREEVRRRSEAASPPLRVGQFINRPNTASALANVEGHVYIICVALIESDFGKAAPRGPRAAIVVTALHLDSAFVGMFGKYYLLNDVHLYTDPAPGSGDAAGVTFRDARGSYLGTLAWTPQRPGRTLLRHAGPAALTVLLAFAAGIAILYRRARLSANDLVASDARATHLAYHDALTGLPNRTLFQDRLAHALQLMPLTATTLAVHCLDLDRFKIVNDTYGHHVGDQLLCKVARMLAALCSERDTVARLAGDEFAVIQADAKAGTAEMLAVRLTDAMRAPIELEVGSVFIGCSVGTTVVSDPGLQCDEILRQADFALYRSKEKAKGQYCFFDPEMGAAIKMRRALEADLRTALADGQLRMVYQPQVDEHARLIGVEALMRWRHPRQGDISPAVFISIAEECGLIVDLGLFALQRAFEDSRRWGGLKVAVNISAKQLRMKTFADDVLRLAARVGVRPQQFELEITEGILLEDDPETLLVLRQLREHGFELAFDDFGSGYSSLIYLQRYPINRIKIDQSFVANLGVSDDAEAVILAIVRLARALRLSVIAEGVETVSQRQHLAAAGCGEMQGYLFSKPVSADEIDAVWSGSGRVGLAA